MGIDEKMEVSKRLGGWEVIACLSAKYLYSSHHTHTHDSKKQVTPTKLRLRKKEMDANVRARMSKGAKK